LAYSPRRYARCDNPTAPIHGTEYQAIANARRRDPRIDGTLGPTRHWNAADSPTFADQIYDHPSAIAQLNVTDSERSGFSATKPASSQNRE